MRILLTGGAGCLGSNLLEHWLPHGHEVLVLDNFVTGRREVVPPGVPGLTVIEGSISDPALVNDAFDRFQPTHVVHAAAAYKDPNDWREDIATNIMGTVHTVEAARRHSVRRFIYLQTALCYGPPERIPVPVDHPCRPISSYGISKLAGENYVALSGLRYLSLRLASVIGPRLAVGVIPTFYSRLKANKPVFCTAAVRDYLHMDDFLAFMDRAMEYEAPVGIYNLGPGEGHAISDVLAAVAAAMKIPIPEPVEMRPVGLDDVETVVLDVSKTNVDFGWKPMVTFTEAIERVVRWYDKNGVSAIYTHLRLPKPTSGSL
ncbi:MAG TPA: NAD-dependent epimerase/dehydratase family protein [Xanthobacteraceae bacterium]|nr:NAD-dependent epimerase/dehydratase family protein [Xanthobacteraceae bacterium]